MHVYPGFVWSITETGPADAGFAVDLDRASVAVILASPCLGRDAIPPRSVSIGPCSGHRHRVRTRGPLARGCQRRRNQRRSRRRRGGSSAGSTRGGGSGAGSTRGGGSGAGCRGGGPSGMSNRKVGPTRGSIGVGGSSGGTARRGGLSTGTTGGSGWSTNGLIRRRVPQAGRGQVVSVPRRSCSTAKASRQAGQRTVSSWSPAAAVTTSGPRSMPTRSGEVHTPPRVAAQPPSAAKGWNATALAAPGRTSTARSAPLAASQILQGACRRWRRRSRCRPGSPHNPAPGPMWPLSVARSLPLAASQIFRVSSRLAETIQVPSGLTAQAFHRVGVAGEGGPFAAAGGIPDLQGVVALAETIQVPSGLTAQPAHAVGVAGEGGPFAATGGVPDLQGAGRRSRRRSRCRPGSPRNPARRRCGR